MTSIRRVLLTSILGAGTLVLCIAAWMSWRAGLQEASELFDAKLAQTSRTLASLVDEPLDPLEGRGGEPIVVPGFHGLARGVGEAMAASGGHAYETKLAFQVRDAHGGLLMRSDSGPATPFIPLRPGYSHVMVDGRDWRAFSLRAPSGRWYQSAELTDIRAEIAREIAFGTVAPLMVAIPLLWLVAWLAVGWATRSVRRVGEAVAERDQGRLAPIALDRVPVEVQGVVDAVNSLLGRLRDALARERRFTADAAHELRTPIAALRVHAWNLREARTEDERAESQQHLDTGVRRMERIVGQLLALSRIDGATRSARDEVDLAALAMQHVADFTALGRTVVLDAAPCTVWGDALALDALVRNLIENAVAYSPATATVAVRVAREGDDAVLVVEDGGPGIPEEARARVFERFHRELGSGVDGSGLGLSLVAQAVSLHGGVITLDASPALGGLRATVRLPSRPTP